MKVMLVRPDYQDYKISNRRLGTIHQPIGLLYLAACLLEDGHEVVICDEMVGDHCREYFKTEKPELVGITVTSLLFERVQEIIATLRTVDPAVPIILGGPHISALPKESLQMSAADAVVAGEGEETLCEIARGDDWSLIKGLHYSRNGDYKANDFRPAPNIHTLPLPARHLLDRRKYMGEHEVGFFVGKKSSLVRLFTSRGCPYQCTFCCSHNIFGRKARFRSPESIMEEIREATTDWKTNNIMFMDDTFTLTKNHVQGVCEELLKSDKKYKWGCFARAGLSEDIIKTMKRAGCHLIGFGVESGSQRVLDSLKKRIKIAEVEETLRLCRKYGIRSKAFIMVGLPGETYEDYEQTKELLLRTKLDYLLVSVFIPLPGSEILNSLPPDTALSQKGNFYYSSDPIWKARQVELLRKFHFRFSYAANCLRKFSFQELPDYWYMFKAFLNVRQNTPSQAMETFPLEQ